MGFIKINENELKTKNYSNLIGNPFKIFERDNEGTNLEAYQEQTQQQIYDISEILIRKEEILEYQYNYDGKRKAAKGYGNFVIISHENGLTNGVDIATLVLDTMAIIPVYGLPASVGGIIYNLFRGIEYIEPIKPK